MNLEARKVNLINWIFSIQESNLIEKLEALQKEGADWWNKVSKEDKQVIDQIAINPRLFPFSDKRKNLRRCVISPQTTLYYRFNGECIELASFRGNRMNPKSLGL